MARRREDDDEDLDDADDRPRRRRRYDDEDDERSIRRGPRYTERSMLDRTFADTSIPILLVFACCCNGIALIMSIIAVLTCQDPTAKRNALIVLIISLISGGIASVSAIVRNMGGF